MMDLNGKNILFKIEKICSWNLNVPKTVYAPREDTYLLADAIIKIGIKVGNAMEIGCGSGALSMLMAHLGWNVTSWDINPNAVLATKCNAKNNGLDGKINVEHNEIGNKLDKMFLNKTCCHIRLLCGRGSHSDVNSTISDYLSDQCKTEFNGILYPMDI